jgi:hypothetical protein
MGRNVLKVHFLSLALLFAVWPFLSTRAAAEAAQASSPANPAHKPQNIIVFQAEIAPECAGKCNIVVVDPESNSTTGAPLQASLRPWNTLTVAAEDTSEYRAKITCSAKCQATTGADSFPLWTFPSSSAASMKKNSKFAGLTLHTFTSNRTNIYYSRNLEKRRRHTDKEDLLLSSGAVLVVVSHIPSSRAICRAQKTTAASLLKVSSLLIWVAGCPLVAKIFSRCILSSPKLC